MATSCDLVAQEVGAGVTAALTAVDCIAGEVSEQAFMRLSDGPMGTLLPILLAFFVAFFGISLTLGRSSLSVRSLAPRIVTIGMVVTFATSFAAFSAVFYNLFVFTPDWIAGILTETQGAATVTFAQKLDVVFIAVQEASSGEKDINVFSPPGMMWLGALLLLLGTVGLLVTARIGLALLLAVGPIFVVMALFNQTRGLFVGWLKGMVMLALAPLFAVVGGSIMLEMAVPILASLVEGAGVERQINQQAAMAFFLVGFVHCMLMLMALIVSSLMVSRWQVFGFAPAAREEQAVRDASRPAPIAPPLSATARAAQVSPGAGSAPSPRRVNVASAAMFAANDTAAAEPSRETVVRGYSSSNGPPSSANRGSSRARGIGNRFKSASPKPSQRGAKRNTEMTR
ncbi:MAG: type IV secretion system protein [Pseudomonadota bacterium]